MNDIIQKLRCWVGKHTWQTFLSKHGRFCIFCYKKDLHFRNKSIENDYDFGVSLTGFNALKK